MLFTCARAEEIWRNLGITNQLNEVLNLDRSGSVVVQDIIMRGGRLQDLDNIGFAELVLNACWYIWLERRQIVHGENVQAPFRSSVSIVVMTRNHMMSSKQPQAKMKEGWKKPLARRETYDQY
jgi:hypothetical protein